MEGLIIGIIITAIFLFIASMRSGKPELDTKPNDLKSFVSEVDDQVALKAIVNFAQQAGYSIDKIDESNRRICLSDSTTLTSWGFLYPIFISRQSDGLTLVEVGIKSKLVAVGPVVGLHHEKCFNGIKAAIFSQSNAVQQTYQDDNRIKCPYCAEMIMPDAKVCRYCGKDLPTIKSISLEHQSLANERKQNPTDIQDDEISQWKAGFSKIGWLVEIGKNTRAALINSPNEYGTSRYSLLCVTYADVKGSHITGVWFNQVDLSSPFTALIATSTRIVLVQPQKKIAKVIEYKNIRIIEATNLSNSKLYTISTFIGDSVKIEIAFSGKDDVIILDAFFERISSVKVNPQPSQSMQRIETTVEQKPPKRRRGIFIVLTIIVILVFAWIFIRPGVFTIQPIGAIPEGVTIIYHSRGSGMPFFSSPDSLCLQTQGSVSLLCRMSALSASTELTNRIILRLPCIRWAYLQSTGGLEFDR